MHVTAKLTIFLGLFVQKECLLFTISFYDAPLGRYRMGLDRRTFVIITLIYIDIYVCVYKNSEQ
jgi:hypothetical protein